MNLKHNSPATKVTDTTNIFWVAAALCWQSAGCNYIGPTQTRPAFYWLQLHWGKYDILTEFRVCCSSVRMKQLQFLLSNNRGPEVFARKKTPTINCHQNDNYHDHHWDETLRTVPVASESIRFYISTYSARFTLLYISETCPGQGSYYCEAQARVRQGSARDGSQGKRPQSLNPCLELTLKLVATFHHHHHHHKFIFTQLMARWGSG